MTECLILGQAGTGKSSVVHALLERDRIAYDADIVPGFCHWVGSDGLTREYQPSRVWRAGHQFRWDMTVIEDLKAKHTGNITWYFAGCSPDIFKAIPLFSKHVLLNVGAETVDRRLREKREKGLSIYPVNDWADEPADQRIERIARTALHDLELAKEIGATVIDGELSIHQVVDDIIAAVET